MAGQHREGGGVGLSAVRAICAVCAVAAVRAVAAICASAAICAAAAAVGSVRSVPARPIGLGGAARAGDEEGQQQGDEEGALDGAPGGITPTIAQVAPGIRRPPLGLRYAAAMSHTVPRLCLLLATGLPLWACAGSKSDSDTSGADGQDGAADGQDGAADGQDGTNEVPFALTSTAFGEGETIPLPHECGRPVVADGPGDNTSPPLTWTAGTAGTGSYALVMRDLDFTPADYPDGLIHWVVYDIPADVTALSEAIDDGAALTAPAGARQAELQGSGYFGYLGPCSPSSVNTYQFTIHAMEAATLSPDDTSEITVAELIESSSIEQATLSGES